VVSEAVTVVSRRHTPYGIYALLTAVSAVWAGNLITSKMALAYLPPFTLATLRFSLMAVLLAVFLRWRSETTPRIAKRDWLSFAVLGLTGVAGFFGLYLLGLRLAPSSDAALIQGLTPLLASVMATVVADEKMTRFKVVGLMASLVGVGIVVLSRAGGGPAYEETRLLGNLAFAGAVVCWAAYAAYGRATMQRFSSAITTVYSTLLGIVVLAPLALLEQPWQAFAIHGGTLEIWALVAYIAFLAGFFCFVSWNEGVRQIGAARAGAFYNLLAVFGLIFASVFLGEEVGLTHALGAGLVIVGAWVTNLQLNSRRGP
jgi:drug/metabolite transporter (DMT)-like permease